MLVGLDSVVVGLVECWYCLRIEDRKDVAEAKEGNRE
jgi:hypothetical protein